MSIQQSSLLLRMFGDTPLDVAINGALIAIFAVILWRTVIRPLITIAMNIRALIKHDKQMALEIIPPKHSQVHPESTQNLISALSKRLRGHDVISLEIISNNVGGIRYRVVAVEQLIDSIQKYLASYLPELRFIVLPVEKDPTSRVFSINQGRHFAYPLKPHGDLAKTDPIAFMTGSMTQLKDDEKLTLQLVVRRHFSKKAARIYNQLLGKGSAVIDGKFRYYTLKYAWIWIPSLIVGVFMSSWQIGIAIALTLWLSNLFAEKETRKLTQLESRLYVEVGAKLESPMLQTDIRFAVHSGERTYKLVDDFVSSLEPLNTAGFQSLKLRQGYFSKWSQSYLNSLFAKRVSSIFLFNSSLLSTSELASLFHFPYGIIKIEGMIRSHSRTLPAPVSLKSGRKLAVMIGDNHHHGTVTPIGLTEAERERHVYIIGGTGNGKTTLLTYGIVQDIRNGNGVAVVDPHGDLAETLLRYIPEERIKDVIYMNPDDLSYPIGVNLLELPEGLEGDDTLREKDRITESVISIMRKLFSDDDSGGHRVEYVLRNTIQTALTLEHPTLFTIFELLNNPRFRRSVTKTLEDENLKHFWINELGKAGDYQKVKMVAGITAKIGRFLFSASAKRILEQEKSTINFDDILDGKILICNFSKGVLGEDTSALFGTMILAKLQLASLRRAQTNASLRRPFYLYVDEFQNFATIGFVQMLSEARKYKLFLTMAEQSTSQQDKQRLVDIILANVGTVICFRSGSPADERLVLPLFSPYIEQGEIANLPAYSYYARIAAVHSQEPMSGVTVLLQDEGSVAIAEQVRVFSRKTYGRFHETGQPAAASQVTPGVKAHNKKQSEAHKAISAIHTKYRA